MAPPHRRRSVAEEIDDGTAIGEVYVRSLVRSQFRLAVGVTLALAATLGILPLVFLVLSDLGTISWGPLPVPWWLLGVAPYPVLLVLGYVVVRRSAHHERAFADLVERP
ncbi:hypothetical protein CLV56_1480 [Mumia flava]|uniref:Uncharacterized protein n=1 Tax=Mumia flava TaxID=1348852 RepID=A0A2M9BH41_9ACTN|nr:hypothetical protein [Mumia flava]PJJ57253.1 hypothetical protein CLV56_1480 [Mumia flava]